MSLYLLFSILIVIAAILLIFAVLVQNSKGGGLAANFSGANQVVGVRQTADFIEKFTWFLAIAIVVLSLASTMAVPHDKYKQASGIENKIKEQKPAATMPTFPNAGAAKSTDAASSEQPAQQPAEKK